VASPLSGIDADEVAFGFPARIDLYDHFCTHSAELNRHSCVMSRLLLCGGTRGAWVKNLPLILVVEDDQLLVTLR
jgi:hypothetical protein